MILVNLYVISLLIDIYTLVIIYISEYMYACYYLYVQKIFCHTTHQDPAHKLVHCPWCAIEKILPII